MELLAKLESYVEAQYKALKLPRLPKGGRVWLKENLWWIVLVLAILSAFSLFGLLGALALGSGVATYAAFTSFVVASVVGWVLIFGLVVLLFRGLDVALLAFAVKPLKEGQRKGWTLLFYVWVLGVLSVVVDLFSQLVSLNLFSFVGTGIAGVVFLGLGGYILFEIRDQFAQVSKSAGVKKRASVRK